MFRQVDARWKNITLSADKIRRVFEICNNDNLRNTLYEDLQILDKVQKNLENYLNLKKSNFSRLFFLSDDELLKILSNTKEPRNIND
jgi:dynein heavy chain